jgi:hypothetical protein
LGSKNPFSPRAAEKIPARIRNVSFIILTLLCLSWFKSIELNYDAS